MYVDVGNVIYQMGPKNLYCPGHEVGRLKYYSDIVYGYRRTLNSSTLPLERE